MKTWLKHLIIALVLTGVSGIVAMPVLADDAAAPAAPAPQVLPNNFFQNLTNTAKGTYTTDSSLSGTDSLVAQLNTIVTIVIGILGSAAVILILYAGLLWMTAGGNEEQISKAKTVIKQTVIGLAVVAFAYGIVATVLFYTTVAGGTGK